jgi:hypothetical protein
VSSTFEDLSQGLSADEKRQLLGRIQASLNLAARDTDSIISKAEAPEDLKNRLTKEVGRLGFLDRFFIRLEAFFRNRSESEVLGDRKLAGTKTTLRDQVGDFVSFSKGEWTPEFAKLLYDLFAEAAQIRPVFDHLFQQKLTLEAGLLRIIDDEYPDAVRDLEDLFSNEDIAAAFQADPRRSALQGEMDRRLEGYFQNVPSAVYDRVRARLRPLYFLRPLAQYPYGFLLELFGHNPERMELAKYPYFLGAPWRKTAGLFERLFYGLHLVNKVDPEDLNLGILFEATAEKIGDEKNAWTGETVNRRLGQFIRQAHETVARVPWREVLQWSFQDPYYSVKFVLPQFSLEEFYQTTLTMNLREELDQTVPEVRQRLLVEERTLLFRNGSFEPLDFYVPGVGASLGPQKVRGFLYPETLGLLWAFLNHHFVKRIQPFHQSLVRLAAPGGKAPLQGLTNVMDDLAALRYKIKQFDRGLHPDSEDGKVFHKLKLELNSKALSLKPFVQMVQEKDSQALELINRGSEGLSILMNQLTGVRDKNVPALKAILRLPYLLEGQQETVENGLERLLVIVQKTQFVLRETQSLET